LSRFTDPYLRRSRWRPLAGRPVLLAVALAALALPAATFATSKRGGTGAPAAGAGSGGARAGAAPSGKGSTDTRAGSPDTRAARKHSGGSAAGEPVANKKGGAPASARSRAKRTPARGAASSHTGGSAAGVTLTGARCVPQSSCSAKAHVVSRGGYLLLSGRDLEPGMVVAFPGVAMARISRASPVAYCFKARLGMEVRVPSSARSGRIVVRAGAGSHSNAFGPIYVVPYALHPPAPKPAPAPRPNAPPGASAFNDQGMWIWYLADSDGGSVATIAAQAHAADIGTVFVKSSDGSTNFWSQFTPQLVNELHAQGLKVCAWQYVYGTDPLGEAELGAKAVADGADCLVIDAEAQYEGRYAAAQQYIEALRAKIGPDYPLGLASFPYVDYHESFPYSVFLGPGGAQFNVPQMYWKDIGTSVANVYVHTYEENLIYGRPICPLGQTFEDPSAQEIVAFRSLAGPYGACGSSYWDWQETTAAGWAALAAPLSPDATVPQPELTSPLLRAGAKGDQVLWLQEHLASAIASQPTNGIFEASTSANLEQFQRAHGIPASGETEPNTWAAVLALPAVAVHWTGGAPQG
jgi:Putative peptidoglycan binding domain